MMTPVIEVNIAAVPKASGAKSLAMIGAVIIIKPWAMALPPASFKTFMMKFAGEGLFNKSPLLQFWGGRVIYVTDEQLDHLPIAYKM